MNDRRLVAGALAVALMLAGTRWASYVGVPPLFLTDVLIGLALVGYALDRTLHQSATPARPPAAYRPLLLALLGWVVIRLFTSPALSLVTLRDAAPYVYAGLGLVAGWAVRFTSPVGVERTRRLLMAALWFHAAWFLTAMLAPSLTAALPAVGGNATVPVFTPRPDVDSAANAVLIGVILIRVALRRTRSPWLMRLAAVAAGVPILIASSRAGLLSLGAALAFSYLVAQAGTGDQRKRLGRLAVVPLLIVGAFLLLPQTQVGERLAGTFGRAISATSAQAAGTADARVTAWADLTDWIAADDTRVVAGVGFGGNFMQESRAIYGLVGYGSASEDSVRSPHNFWLGTWARLGLVGLGLVGVIVSLTLRRIWLCREILARDDLALIAGLVVPTFVVAATVGVVLEAPFGAVPFWWCVGIVCSIRQLAPAPGVRPRRASPPRVRQSSLRG